MDADNTPTDTGLDAFVPSSTTSAIATELVALVDSIQHNEALMSSAIQCTVATGIVSIASDLPKVIFDSAIAFRGQGYCHLKSQKQQVNRFTYMLSYAVGNHLEHTLRVDNDCEYMTALPYQCGIGTLVDDAVEAAAELYDGVFCSDRSTNGHTDVELLELPESWEPAAVDDPVFSCVPRDDDHP